MACPRCGHPADPQARFCSQCGIPLESAAAPAEGERRHATIVMSDLSGYTALNERLDPEEVEEIMAAVKAAARKAIERHGGVVNQFIGDEVIGLFGIPIARRDDTARAVRAALDLHGAVDALSAEIAPRLGRAIRMHTGINTGLLLARTSDSREGRYLLTGDTINTAARLLSLAADGEIVVGQETWREIADRFHAEERPATEVKGKERPVVPWRVLRERALDQAPRRALCGRRDECDAFDALLRHCLADRRGGVIVVRGEAGIGKTRLVGEFTRCAEALGVSPHRALVLDFQPERGGDAIRTLARDLAAVAPPQTDAAEQRIYLADLLDHELPADLRPLAVAMSEAVRGAGTRAALAALVTAAAAQAPRLLLIEDLHWADDWVTDHVAVLAAATAQAPVVLVVTTRPEGDRVARLGSQPAPTIIDLAPLAMAEMQALAAQFGEVASPVVQGLVERAEGNPLFLEQLLLNVGEQVRHDLPGSIQGLVLARLDRLAAADRTALQAAAVLGQRFSLETLRWLLDDPRQDCASLLDHSLIRPDGDGFLFWHALIRDGAYAALLKSRRRQLHARAADWYRGRDPTVAAEHLERAEDPAAADAFLDAAQAEAGRFRYERAVALVDRGLALAPTDAGTYALRSTRAGLLLEMGHGHEALLAWQDALARASTDADRCRAHLGRAAAMRLVDQAADGFAALAEAEALATAPAMALERAQLHHLRGNLCFGLGRVDECLAEHQQALAEATAAGSAEAEANALGGLGDAYYIRGRMRSAHAQFRRCVELAQAGGFGRIEVANLHMVGWAVHALGRLGEAVQIGVDCIDKAHAVSHRRVEVLARILVAYVQGWLLGEVEVGHRELDLALRISQDIGAKRFEGQVRTYQAQMALRAGERAVAARLAEDALAFCRLHGMAFFGPVALGLAGRLADRPETTAAYFSEARAILDAGAISHCHFEFHAHAIEAALAQRRWADAEADCARLETFTAAEPLELPSFLIARGRTLAAIGRGEAGSDLAARLEDLIAEATACEFKLWRPALVAANAGRGA